VANVDNAHLSFACFIFCGGGLSVAVSANGQKETASLYVYPAGKDNPLETGDTSRDNLKTLARVIFPALWGVQYFS